MLFYYFVFDIQNIKYILYVYSRKMAYFGTVVKPVGMIT